MRQKYLRNVVTLEYDTARCFGCSLCATVCPHNVFSIHNSKAQIINRDSCMECGACVRNCPVGALSVNAGVGCATAIIQGMLTGKQPSCC